ncbi:MAG TPA: hypothetical protein VFD58_31280 [Blastocatellia bacterium]|nr:hypothetical protein [Blastocatellia bacterium]
MRNLLINEDRFSDPASLLVVRGREINISASDPEETRYAELEWMQVIALEERSADESDKSAWPIRGNDIY